MTRQSMRRAIALSFLLFAAVAIPGTRLVAQQSPHLTIAAVTRLPDTTATAMIVREVGPAGRTLILMRDDRADAATLATALKSLDRSRRKRGDLLQQEVVITLHGHRQASALTADEQQQANDYVSRLRNSAAAPLAGHGVAKTVIVPLSPISGVVTGSRLD